MCNLRFVVTAIRRAIGCFPAPLNAVFNKTNYDRNYPPIQTLTSPGEIRATSLHRRSHNQVCIQRHDILTQDQLKFLSVQEQTCSMSLNVVLEENEKLSQAQSEQV